MELRLVKRMASNILFLSMVFGASGCFDVHTADPGPLVIDDFDDGDFVPADSHFGAWVCSAFNPDTNPKYNCDHDGGYQSQFALFLDATIDDAPDGTQQHGGAQLRTEAALPQDISHFGELVFSAKLESGSPPIPSNALLYVEIGCNSAYAEDGSRPGDLYVVQGVDYKSYWQTFQLALSSFGSPPWLATHIKGGPEACLAGVSNLRFTVDPQMPDGQTGKFVLHVDNVYLQ
jgi:hypothetical protein